MLTAIYLLVQVTSNNLKKIKLFVQIALGSRRVSVDPTL